MHPLNEINSSVSVSTLLKLKPNCRTANGSDSWPVLLLKPVTMLSLVMLNVEAPFLNSNILTKIELSLIAKTETKKRTR